MCTHKGLPWQRSTSLLTHGRASRFVWAALRATMCRTSPSKVRGALCSLQTPCPWQRAASPRKKFVGRRSMCSSNNGTAFGRSAPCHNPCSTLRIACFWKRSNTRRKRSALPPWRYCPNLRCENPMNCLIGSPCSWTMMQPAYEELPVKRWLGLPRRFPPAFVRPCPTNCDQKNGTAARVLGKDSKPSPKLGRTSWLITSTVCFWNPMLNSAEKRPKCWPQSLLAKPPWFGIWFLGH